MDNHERPHSLANELGAELRMFTGDLDRWRHPVYSKLLYTAGVRHLLEKAGAYWLLDAIASWLPSRMFARARATDSRLGEICFWRLKVAEDRSATLVACADSDEPPVIEQSIQFTDFPLDEIDLYCAFDGDVWTLMLPGEY